MSSSDPLHRVPTIPKTLMWVGIGTAAQGALGLIVAATYIIREALGHKEVAISGYGTAIWFGVIGGTVFAGGLALTRGRRWGRAISLMAQILLLPVSYYVVSSGWPAIGIPVAILAVVLLALLFAPASVMWLDAADLPPDA